MSTPRARPRLVAAHATELAMVWAGGLVALVLGVPLVAGLHYVGVDLTRLDLAVGCELRHALATGGSLLLSPHLGDGAPFLARPGAQLFYPVRWLLLPLPTDLAVSLGVVLHLSAAAAGTAWLLRAHGLRPFAAATAGLFFALSGVCLDLVRHSYYVAGAAVLPLVWASARRALQPRAPRLMPALCAVFLALALLGGEPQAAMLGLALLSLELVRARAWTRVRRRSAALLLLASAGGLALGLLPWWSFLAEARLGGRHAGLPLALIQRWSFDPAQWAAALLSGDLFAQPRPSLSLWQSLAGSVEGAWNQAPYLGALFVAALISAALCRRACAPWWAGLLALVLALGSHLPALGALAWAVPPLALFRYPQKYLLVATLAATVAVWVWLPRALRCRSGSRRLFVAVATMLVGMLVVALVLVLGRQGFTRLALEASEGEPLAGLEPLASSLARACVRAALPLAAALLLLTQPRLRAQAIPALLVVDVALAGVPQLPVGAALSDLASPLRHLASSGRAPSVCVAPFQRELIDQQPGAASRAEWTQMAMYRLYQVPDLQACDASSSPLLYSPLQTHASEGLQAMLDAHHLAAARALGCSHLVAAHPPVDEPAPRLSVAGDPSVVEAGPHVYLVPSPLPEAFVIREPRLLRGVPALLDQVALTRSAEEVSRVVDDPLGRWPGDAPLPDGAGARSVRLERLATTHLRLEVVGEGAAVIGVRQSFWVGWSAQQGARALPVVRIAGQQLGVIVDDVSAGRVELRYRLPRWRTGVLTALAGALLVAAAIGLRRRGPRGEA